MTFRRLIIVLLTLNLAVLLYFLVLRPTKPVEGETQEKTLANVEGPRIGRAAKPEPVTTVTNQFRWQQLESENYREYIDRLREVGCPEETIRDIIIADLDKLFSPRLRAALPYRETLHYWEPEEEELLNNVDPGQKLAHERAVEQEKRDVMKELMGVNLAMERVRLKGQEDFYERRLQFLPAEKRLELRTALEKYHDLDQKIREKQWKDNEPLTVEDRAELRRNREAREAELSQLLSAPEREQFELWLSDTASNVRHDVYGMDISEAEFLTIFNQRKEFDRSWPGDELDLSDPALRQGWETAKAQLDNKIRVQLGEARYADYQRGRDPDFHTLNALVSRYNLPRDKAAEVYDYKRAYQDFRDAVGYNQTMTPEQKDVAFRGMLDETVRAVRGTLGERAFGYYRGRADWLKK